MYIFMSYKYICILYKYNSCWVNAIEKFRVCDSQCALKKGKNDPYDCKCVFKLQEDTKNISFSFCDDCLNMKGKKKCFHGSMLINQLNYYSE